MYESENKTMNPDEELVDILLDFIIVAANLVFHFFDGRDIEAEWKNKRTMPPHSEERKAEMSRKMKENWRKRRGESNDHSGNNQPVHSDTD